MSDEERDRERFRRDTILRALHEVNDPPDPSTRYCSRCHRRGYYDVSFKRNLWEGVCDECQDEVDTIRRESLGE
jgi:hypothetical protein